jgi:positive regulator of sigma E activity
MRDSARVIRVEKDLAWVQAEPRIPCCDCSALSLCAGKMDPKGHIVVRNPLRARPGDDVEIEVPETDYSRELAKIFGLLLFAALAGMALGHIVSPLKGFTPGENGFFGLLAGLLLCGFVIYRHYHRGKASVRWPVIVGILDKGEPHG